MREEYTLNVKTEESLEISELAFYLKWANIVLKKIRITEYDIISSTVQHKMSNLAWRRAK